MSIFRRTSKKAAEPSESSPAPPPRPRRPDHGVVVLRGRGGADHRGHRRRGRTRAGRDADAVDDFEAGATELTVATAPSRAAGPFDRSEVEDTEGRLDLGSLWLAGIPGMELRLEVDQEADTVVGVTAVLGESAVQLQAFAAPRSEGIWEEIRGEIAASITRQGGTAEDTVGPLGRRAADPHARPGRERPHRLLPGPLPRRRRPAVVPAGGPERPRRDRPRRRRAADRRRPRHRGRARRRADGAPRPAAADPARRR